MKTQLLKSPALLLMLLTELQTKQVVPQCACFVVTTFTNTYRGSQPLTIALPLRL